MDLINLIQLLAVPRIPGSRELDNVRQVRVLLEKDKKNAQISETPWKIVKNYTETEILLDFDLFEDTFIDKPPDPYEATEFTNLVFTYTPDNPQRRLVLAAHIDSKVNPRLGETITWRKFLMNK